MPAESSPEVEENPDKEHETSAEKSPITTPAPIAKSGFAAAFSSKFGNRFKKEEPKPESVVDPPPAPPADDVGSQKSKGSKGSKKSKRSGSQKSNKSPALDPASENRSNAPLILPRGSQDKEISETKSKTKSPRNSQDKEASPKVQAEVPGSIAINL